MYRYVYTHTHIYLTLTTLSAEQAWCPTVPDTPVRGHTQNPAETKDTSAAPGPAELSLQTCPLLQVLWGTRPGESWGQDKLSRTDTASQWTQQRQLLKRACDEPGHRARSDLQAVKTALGAHGAANTLFKMFKSSSVKRFCLLWEQPWVPLQRAVLQWDRSGEMSMWSLMIKSTAQCKGAECNLQPPSSGTSEVETLWQAKDVVPAFTGGAHHAENTCSSGEQALETQELLKNLNWKVKIT